MVALPKKRSKGRAVPVRLAKKARIESVSEQGADDDNKCEPRSNTSSVAAMDILTHQSKPRSSESQDAEEMLEAGIVMNKSGPMPRVSSECEQLLIRLTEPTTMIPQHQWTDPALLRKLFEGSKNHNRARVIRDVTPMLIPSPYSLRIETELLGGADYLISPLIGDVVKPVWTAGTICDTTPKLAHVAGMTAFELDDEEQRKLGFGHATTDPGLYMEGVCFPFLVCSTEGGRQSIEKAEMDAMHGASIAVRAIIELYQRISAEAELDCKILTFSLTHNDKMAKLFGHYAKIEGENITYYREHIHTSMLTKVVESDELWTIWRIVLAIYQHFFPIHLKRIRTALARMPDPISISTSDTHVYSAAARLREWFIDKNDWLLNQISLLEESADGPPRSRLLDESVQLIDEQIHDWSVHDRDWLLTQVAKMKAITWRCQGLTAKRPGRIMDHDYRPIKTQVDEAREKLKSTHRRLELYEYNARKDRRASEVEVERLKQTLCKKESGKNEAHLEPDRGLECIVTAEQQFTRNEFYEHLVPQSEHWRPTTNGSESP